MPEQKVSLATIAHSAAIERFDAELQKVFDNIMDPNTSAEAKREIVLRATFKPNETRSMVAVLISAVSKEAPSAGCTTVLYLGLTRNGKAQASEYDPDQLTLPNIRKIGGSGEEEK